MGPAIISAFSVIRNSFLIEYLNLNSINAFTTYLFNNIEDQINKLPTIKNLYEKIERKTFYTEILTAINTTIIPYKGESYAFIQYLKNIQKTIKISKEKEALDEKRETVSLLLQKSNNTEVLIKQPTLEQRTEFLKTKLDPYLYHILSDKGLMKELGTAEDTKTNHFFFFSEIYHCQELNSKQQADVLSYRKQLQAIYPECSVEMNPLYQIIQLVDEINRLESSLKDNKEISLNGKIYTPKLAAKYLINILKKHYSEQAIITPELQENILLIVFRKCDDIALIMETIDYLLKQLVDPENEKAIPKGNIVPNVLLAALKHLRSRTFIEEILPACMGENKTIIQPLLYSILFDLRKLFDNIVPLQPKVSKTLLGTCINTFRLFLDILLCKIKDRRIEDNKIYNTLADQGTRLYYYMFMFKKASPVSGEQDKLIEDRRGWDKLLKHYALSFDKRAELFIENLKTEELTESNNAPAELEPV
jgi:hypothetical protein